MPDRGSFEVAYFALKSGEALPVAPLVQHTGILSPKGDNVVLIPS